MPPGRELVDAAILIWSIWLAEMLGVMAGLWDWPQPSPHVLLVLGDLTFVLTIVVRVMHARAQRRRAAPSDESSTP